MLILISDPFHPGLEEKLSLLGDVSTARSAFAEADIILVRSETKADRSYLEKAKHLKLIIRGGVGIDNIDIETANRLGIKVHNTPKASSIAVAEMAMTLILSLTNNVVKADTTMHNKEWLKKQLKRTELFSKTLGIIGYGRIGNELARRAKAFGMTIIGYHYRDVKSEFGEMSTDLKEVLNQSDYVSLHLPLTDKTKNFINKSTLMDCKPNAYIINTGRGGTVDEHTLSEALKKGGIAGYASDVWSQSPPADSPLMNAPNVLMTPHLGASTQECMIRVGEEIVQIIEKFIKKISEKEK